MTRATLTVSDVVAGYKLTVGELEQLEAFIQDNRDLLPETYPGSGQYDWSCLVSAARIVSKRRRSCLL